MRQKIIATLLLVILSLGFLSISSKDQQAEAQPSKSNSKVVFFLIDNVTWADLIAADDPILNSLIKKSSIGVMNNRAFKNPSRPRNALTVGSGIRAEAASRSLEGYNAVEPYDDGLAREAYKLRTGRSAKGYDVVELGIASVVKDNDKGLQEFIPGQLADIIESSSKSTAVLGNSDTSLGDEPGTRNREAVAIAMNSRGVVKYGDVGKTLLKRDPKYPFGIRADHKKLEARFREFYEKADFTVIDLGDTVRADYYQGDAFERQAIKLKAQAIHACASFIERAMVIAGQDTTFIIASLSPQGSNKFPLRGSLEQMTPIIIHGPSYTSGGLVSGTTRRDGFVSIIDIAPTVLNILGSQKIQSMPGSPMQTGLTKVSPESLDSFNQSAIGIKSTRRTALLAFIYFQIALYALAALALAFRKILTKTTLTILETLIFTIMGFPLFSFYTTKLGTIANYGILATLLTILISLAFAILLMLTRKKALHPVISMSALTLAVLSLDALMGARSFGNTIFGYDLIRGARYFGIGNEAMSIFIACTLLLFGAILEKTWNRWMVIAGAVICATIILIIGFPKIGANTGGTIAAVFAFAAMLLQAMKSKAKIRNTAIAVTAVVAVLGVFVAYDVTHGSTTHMGKTINLIMTGGVQEIFIIIKRKLAVNFMILKYSTWSYFLLIALGLLAFLWFKPVGVLRRSLVNHKGISASISAAIVGGVAGFIFNDSGILVPAIIMSYMIPTVVYLMLWERYQSTG